MYIKNCLPFSSEIWLHSCACTYIQHAHTTLTICILPVMKNSTTSPVAAYSSSNGAYGKRSSIVHTSSMPVP